MRPQGRAKSVQMLLTTKVPVLGALVLGVLLSGSLSGCSYNQFTSQEEGIKGAWGEVENQLQRRNDLIPNLVETVKGYAAQEKSVIQAVSDSRAKLAGASTPADKIEAANEQTGALGRLLAISENYPQLKSNENFMRLQDELSGTENRIAVARGRYNQRITDYNTLRRRFPANMTAKVFGFKEYPYFNAPESAKAVPKVDFSTPR